MKRKSCLFGMPTWIGLMLGVMTTPLSAQEVGIGTTTPAARLDIQAPAAYTGGLLRVLHGTNAYLIVDNNGRVGIGTAAPAYRLHVTNDGMIYADGTYGSGTTIPAGAKTAFIWTPNNAAVRAGRVTGSQWDPPLNVPLYSVAFGYNGIAANFANTVSGGYQNATSGTYGGFSTVSGGSDNIASGSYSTVSGGCQNAAGTGYTVVSGFSTVSGGYNNTASGNYSTVSGGYQNAASGFYSTVSGGNQNTASEWYSTVGGGYNNTASGNSSTVSGGYNNTASGNYSTVSGGNYSTASGNYSTSGGFLNAAGGNYSTMSGGYNNTASGNYSTVSGGYQNAASGFYSTVSGGRYNAANGFYSTVSGGNGNTASGSYSTVSGGYQNAASGNYSTASGGYGNTASGSYSTVSGGYYSAASGGYSMVSGGGSNSAGGDYSWVGGWGMKLGAAADRTFAWGYTSYNSTINIVSDAFLIGPWGNTINVGIGTPDPPTRLVVWGPHAGAGIGNGTASNAPSQTIIPAGSNGSSYFNDWPVGWSGGLATYDICGLSAYMNGYMTRSDRRFKTDITSLTKDQRKLLQRFMQLRPVAYFLNAEKLPVNNPDRKRFGFIANEVEVLFPNLVVNAGAAPDVTRGLEYDGFIPILVAAVQQRQQLLNQQQVVIQQQQKMIGQQQTEIRRLKSEMEAHAHRLAAVEALLNGQSNQE